MIRTNLSRRLTALASLLLVVGGIGVFTAAPARADESSPTLSASQGYRGVSYKASATDWAGCLSMSLTGWGRALGTASINPAGAFTLTFTVPGDAPLGTSQLQFSPMCPHSTWMPPVPFTVVTAITVTGALTYDGAHATPSSAFKSAVWPQDKIWYAVLIRNSSGVPVTVNFSWQAYGPSGGNKIFADANTLSVSPGYWSYYTPSVVGCDMGGLGRWQTGSYQNSDTVVADGLTYHASSNFTITRQSNAGGNEPVDVCGSDWLGGRGVPVCAPGTSTYCGGQLAVGTAWQCVELAQRLYKTMGWYAQTSNGVFSVGGVGIPSAYLIYDNANALGFTRVANGSITSLTPGDMIVHKSTSPGSGGAGHVAIVDTVQGSTVTAREQNWSLNGTATYNLANGWLSRTGPVATDKQYISGVVHR